MKPMFFACVSSRHGLALTAILLTLGSVSNAQAQQVYRIVGPDGKVSFSDQPPPTAGKPKVPGAAAAPVASASGASGADRLPFELSKVARQFPVVLFTSKDCAPCNSGRNLLTSRGIPFAEKTVDNPESFEALKQLSGQGSLPLLTIGAQQLKGYSDTNWTQYLNAAGYPEKSALPANYKRTAPVALAEAKAVQPASSTSKAKASKEPAEAALPDTPVAPPASGIRF